MKKTELNYEEVYELYINQKKTLKQVAEALDTSTMVVCRFTKANNMTKSKEEVRASIEETNLKNYGVKNPMQNKEIHQKASATYKAKTGYDNPAQNPEVQKKIRATSLEVYGTEVPAQSEEVKAKIAATCLERYGAENYFGAPGVNEKIREEYKRKTGYDNPQQNPEVKEKTKQTCIKKYGVSHPSKLPETTEKRRRTNMQIYGTASPSCLPEIQEKVKQTNRERYGADYYPLSEEFRKKTDSYLISHGGGREYNFYSPLGEKAKSIFSSRGNFENFLSNLEEKTTAKVATLLDCSLTTVVRMLGEYELWHYIDNRTSEGEREIGEFLTQIGVSYEKSRKAIAPFEIDLYCDEYKIGIEYNGVYWHSDKKIDKKYHLSKTLAAANKGIFLYHIFEYEWKDPAKQAKIKAQLANLFGKNPQKIYARQCDLRPVPASQKTEFLEANHLQGTDTAPIAYGLYFNEELVAIMTFKKPYLNHNFDWELSRFCCKVGLSVVGGASRLFKAFLENYSGSIISYSNNAKTRGKLYETLGFKREKDSPPSFVYTNGHDITLSRHQSRSEEGKKLIEKYHLYKVYDCGNKVWTYKR